MDTTPYIEWRQDGDGYESHDWRWAIKPGRDPELFDVRDHVDMEWVLFDVPLAQAQAFCEAQAQAQLDELRSCIDIDRLSEILRDADPDTILTTLRELTA